MADLSAAKRAALVQVIAQSPDTILPQIAAMAAATGGATAEFLRQSVADEMRNRGRRKTVLEPLLPLFRPRADGLPGLTFPADVERRLWSLATAHEPQLMPQLDRGDDLARIIGDRLCFSAAMTIRDQPETAWPGASEAQIEDLVAALDLIGLIRRCAGGLDDWLARPGAEAAAELRLALRQAEAVAPGGAARLMEILFAYLPHARLMLRLVGLASPVAGREGALNERELSVYVERVVTALSQRAEEAVQFDPSAADADFRHLKALLDWCAETLIEIDVSLPLKPNGVWAKAVRRVRRSVVARLSEHFVMAEAVVMEALPVEKAVLAGRMKRPVPKLDQAFNVQTAVHAKALLSVVGMVRRVAKVFGCEADRRQTAESLTWRIASWADEAIERLNDGLVADPLLARARITLAAELLRLIDAGQAARSVQRRLSIVSPSNVVSGSGATSEASLQVA